MRAEPVDAREDDAGEPRARGVVVLLGIVLLGLLSGAAYYHYQRPKLAAERERLLASAPTTPEGRLELWHRFGAPSIHRRLCQVARFSSELPWLVTHAVAAGPAGEAELWGIDCSRLGSVVSRVEGLAVVIELPAPAALGRAPLTAEQAHRVPVYGSAEEAPDPAGRLRGLVLFFLEDMPEALARDIPGATIEIRIGP